MNIYSNVPKAPLYAGSSVDKPKNINNLLDRLIAFEQEFTDLTKSELTSKSVDRLGLIYEEILRFASEVRDLNSDDMKHLKVGAYELAARVVGVVIDHRNQVDPLPWDVVQVYSHNAKGRLEFANPEEMNAYLKKKLSQAIDKGTIQTFATVDAHTLKDINSDVIYEFSLRHDNVLACGVDLSHVVLSGGQPLLAAGNFVIRRDAEGDIESVIIGDWSGHYSPDVAHLERVVGVFEKLGVPKELIVTTQGEPLSPRMLKDVFASVGSGDIDFEAKAKEFQKHLANASKQPPATDVNSRDTALRWVISQVDPDSVAKKAEILEEIKKITPYSFTTVVYEYDDVEQTDELVKEALAAGADSVEFIDAKTLSKPSSEIPAS